MPDLLRDGESWLAGQQKAFGSQTIEYRRGLRRITELQATIGRTLLNISDEVGNVRSEWTDRDYLIDRGDLKLNEREIEPEPGDQIIETTGGKIRTFEVLALGSEPPWRWSDPYMIRRRIHCKEVKEK